MILHTQLDTTLTADAEHNFIQTVIKLRFDPRLCQFLMKIIPVINCVRACVRTSAEDDDFPREGVFLLIFI